MKLNHVLLLLTSFVLFPLNAAATAVPPGFQLRLRESESNPSRLSVPYFQINERDCKAWVSIDVEDPRGPEIGGEVGHRDLRRVQRSGLIPGLSFDCRTREIIWNQMVCATVEATSFWSPIPRIRPTGACRLSVTESYVLEDDGYRIFTIRRVDVGIHADRP